MQTPQFEGGNINLVLFGFDTGDYNHVKLPYILKNHFCCINYLLKILVVHMYEKSILYQIPPLLLPIRKQ